MGIREPHPVAGELVEVRRLEFGLRPVAWRLAVAHVVEKNKDDVGLVGCCWGGGVQRGQRSQQQGGEEESVVSWSDLGFVLVPCFCAFGGRCPFGRFGIGDLQRRSVAVFFPRLFQQCGQFLDLVRGFRLAGEVGHLVRVGLQVEELGLVDERIADQLPAVVPDGTLAIPVGREQAIAHFRLTALDDRREALGIQPRRHGNAGQVAEGRIEVDTSRPSALVSPFEMPGPAKINGTCMPPNS